MRFPRRFIPEVSSHAVVRWMEIFQGADFDHVRAAILAAGREDWIAQGAYTIHVPDLGISLLAQDGTVITIRDHQKPGARR